MQDIQQARQASKKNGFEQMSTTSLQQEIEAGRQTIRAESYAMSIGELVSLYQKQELAIRPEFQRLFRWSNEQKSRLIESLLLGIPLPSIFVMQREDGIWEVIDGLQRVSTILEFMGELRDETSGELQPATILGETEYLPSLAGTSFGGDDADGATTTLTSGQRLSLKRAKIDVKILLPESDEKAKFELFDRLNAGGSVATPQEIRSAQLIMRDSSMYEWVEELRTSASFQATISISDRLYEEAYDAELVCRYLSLVSSAHQEWRNLKSMDKFISSKMFALTADSSFDRSREKDRFEFIFGALSSSLGDEAFRRYDDQKSRFLGAFSVSAFESITVGVANSEGLWRRTVAARPERLSGRIKALWDNQDFRAGSGSGIGASTRIPRTLPAAIQHFKTA